MLVTGFGDLISHYQTNYKASNRYIVTNKNEYHW